MTGYEEFLESLLVNSSPETKNKVLTLIYFDNYKKKK